MSISSCNSRPWCNIQYGGPWYVTRSSRKMIWSHWGCEKMYYNYLKPGLFRVGINKETSTTRQLDFSVPQSSMQGAHMHQQLVQIVTNLTLNGFAGDHSIRKEFECSRLGKDETKTIKIIESCMLIVKDQMGLDVSEDEWKQNGIHILQKN